MLILGKINGSEIDEGGKYDWMVIFSSQTNDETISVR